MYKGTIFQSSVTDDFGNATTHGYQVRGYASAMTGHTCYTVVHYDDMNDMNDMQVNGDACRSASDLLKAISDMTDDENGIPEKVAEAMREEIAQELVYPDTVIYLDSDPACWGSDVDDDEASEYLEEMIDRLIDQYPGVKVELNNGRQKILSDDKDLADQINRFINGQFLMVINHVRAYRK